MGSGGSGGSGGVVGWWEWGSVRGAHTFLLDVQVLHQLVDGDGTLMSRTDPPSLRAGLWVSHPILLGCTLNITEITLPVLDKY